MEYFEIFSLNEIKKIIAETFANDPNQREHFISKDYESGVKDTYEKNKAACEEYKASFYKLSNEKGELLGFVNIIKGLRVLFSFGLKYDQRTEANKKAFIEVIEEIIPEGEIVCTLYDKNKRGIRFLERNGYKIDNIVVLKKQR